MSLEAALVELRADPAIRANITHWRELPARPARVAPFPAQLDPRLRQVLAGRGIEHLYTHQVAAVEQVLAGRPVVVVTPTASGKTLCYNLPVLNAVLRDPQARALYLFPTKALAQDQMAELQRLVTDLEVDIKTHTYDGDTPANARKLIRSAGHIVVTNPDMLHTGVLPHHTKWIKLFEHLRYVVLDELHHYRGVFGSHVANVIRRLRRICAFYGSDPLFICCSATIANPAELAAKIIGGPVTLVDDNGAPTGAKHVIFYNPPVVNSQLGLRASSVLEARRLATRLLAHDVQTLVFARSRTTVELLLTYLHGDTTEKKRRESAIRGYRGGYLPNLRREIERGLRDGSVRGVVSTNALELGVDIGSLEATVLTGYPGTVASTLQQMGRSGRRAGTSLAVLVASSSPLDQYIANHPEYFFGRSPESGLINPDNLLILANHLKCAAFELPFGEDEAFGLPLAETQELLGLIEEDGLLHHAQDRWHWTSEGFPAETISLRSASSENFVVIDNVPGAPRIIGEVDRISAPTMLHDEAIYLHEGEQYQVERLDYAEKKAYVRHVDVDYYTDANLAFAIKPLEIFAEESRGATRRIHGTVMLTYQPTMFKKIKLYTHENVGSGRISLPEEELHTTAYWLTLDGLAAPGSALEPASRGANAPVATENTPLLELEAAEGGATGGAALTATPALDPQAGLLGISHVLAHVAPLFLMCDPHDLGVVPELKSPHTGQPTIYLFDKYPGGTGLSERLYELHDELLRAAAETIAGCGCPDGCPSCVGPRLELGTLGKASALALMRQAQRPWASMTPVDG
jgi:DEAD/DEAH box helicase domain-containing protein